MPRPQTTLQLVMLIVSLVNLQVHVHHVCRLSHDDTRYVVILKVCILLKLIAKRSWKLTVTRVTGWLDYWSSVATSFLNLDQLIERSSKAIACLICDDSGSIHCPRYRQNDLHPNQPKRAVWDTGIWTLVVRPAVGITAAWEWDTVAVWESDFSLGSISGCQKLQITQHGTMAWPQTSDTVLHAQTTSSSGNAHVAAPSTACNHYIQHKQYMYLAVKCCQTKCMSLLTSARDI